MDTIDNNVVEFKANETAEVENEVNEVKEVDKETTTINVVRTHVPYTVLRAYVNFVANMSVDVNGHYHEYLKDFGITLALLMMYTDIDVDLNSIEENFDTIFEIVLSIAHGSEWKNEIVPQFGEQFDIFYDYVDAEIERITSPSAKIEETLNTINKFLNNINEFMDAIDIEKLRDADFSQLLEASRQLSEVEAKEAKES